MRAADSVRESYHWIEQWELEDDGGVDSEGQTVRESKVPSCNFYLLQAKFRGFLCFYTT